MKRTKQENKTAKPGAKTQGPHSAGQDKYVRRPAKASAAKDDYDEPSRESQTKSRSGNRVSGSNH